MAKISVSKKEMHDKTYTISGRKAFIHAYIDTGFKTKWCGIWAPPYKFFEYFAFNINKVWLSPENILRATIEKGEVKQKFDINGFDITVILFTPKKKSSVIVQVIVKNKNNSKKKVSIDLETALNIRTKFENFHFRGYETEFFESKNAVLVSSEGKSAAFGMGKTGKNISVEFEKKEYYKEHYPGGEKQRCFIAGNYRGVLEIDANECITLPFIFACSPSNKEDALRDFELCFHDAQHSHLLKHTGHTHTLPEIITPDKELDSAYFWAASNTIGLLNESAIGVGVFAGYPWFLEFWGRDTFWSVLGLVDLGKFDEAKNILITMANFQKERMPCVLNLDGSAKYHGRDVDALFIVALDYYITYSGDKTAEKTFSKNIAASIKSLSLKNGLVEHEPNETWMDSIPRTGTAVEVQSLWIEALKKSAPKDAQKMKDALKNKFWNEKTGFLNDTVSSTRKSSNALVPLMFGQIEKKHALIILKNTRNELLGNYGIATLSKNDESFGPSKYHEGASWGLTTAIGACAFFKYSMADEGINCLKPMASDVQENTLGGMSECLDSETGNLLGCGMQLWSAALFIHAIDSYLFGINSRSNKIIISPQMPSGWKSMARKNKRMQKNIFDISITRNKGRWEFDIRFKETPKNKVSVIIPEKIYGAHLNNVQIMGDAPSGALSEIKNAVLGKGESKLSHSIEFEAEKNNILVIRTSY